MKRKLAIDIAQRSAALRDLCDAVKATGSDILIDITPDMGNPEVRTPSIYVEPLSELMSFVLEGEQVKVEEEYLGDNSPYKYRVWYELEGVEFHTVCTEQELAESGLSSDA